MRLQEQNLPFLRRMGIAPRRAEKLIETAYRMLKKDDDKEILSKAYELYMKERTSEREESVPDGAEEADLRNIQDYGVMTKGMLSEKEEW